MAVSLWPGGHPSSLLIFLASYWPCKAAYNRSVGTLVLRFMVLLSIPIADSGVSVVMGDSWRPLESPQEQAVLALKRPKCLDQVHHFNSLTSFTINLSKLFSEKPVDLVKFLWTSANSTVKEGAESI